MREGTTISTTHPLNCEVPRGRVEMNSLVMVNEVLFVHSVHQLHLRQMVPEDVLAQPTTTQRAPTYLHESKRVLYGKLWMECSFLKSKHKIKRKLNNKNKKQSDDELRARVVSPCFFLKVGDIKNENKNNSRKKK